MTLSDTPPPVARPTTSAPARILVAEDEALIAEELRDRLEAFGHTVVDVVASGQEAVEVAARERPDLVLMDIRLKGRLDGIDAAAALGERHDVPVVYLTAHSDDGTIRRAKRTAPLAYLVKPVEERELFITVDMALEKAAAERRLRESEQRYATTLTSIGDAVIATDPEGRVTFMNPVAEALTRWDRTAATGLPLAQVFRLIHAVTRLPVDCPVARALAEDQVVLLPDHCLLVARDGTEVPVDDSAAPIRDRQERTRGAVLVFRDTSDRRAAEEAARRAEEQLRQAQKMEAVGRLAGGVAHDINNLMTVVIGYGELALGLMAADHPARDMVAEMKRAGDRAAGVTRQLLAFSRKQAIAPVVLDLNKLVADVCQMLGRLLGEDVRLGLTAATDLKPVTADPTQMEQVVLNLAVNARDAMPDGGHLTLDTRNVRVDDPPEAGLPPGWYVRLSVTDTGTGMDAATRARIFEPFFTTKELGQGTGLGLATVYGIVHQCGGFVTVDTAPGRGTTFHVHLPPTASDEVQMAPATTTARGTETVLLVEDDPGVRALVAEVLRAHGYTVVAADDGPAALRLCDDGVAFDLLLSDAIMPGMSGRQLAERVAARRPEARVMFMSGYTEDRILQDDIRTRAVAFLHKPFTAVELTARVREALDHRPSGQSG